MQTLALHQPWQVFTSFGPGLCILAPFFTQKYSLRQIHFAFQTVLHRQSFDPVFYPNVIPEEKELIEKIKKSNNSHHWNVKKLILFFTKENMSTVFYSLRGRILKLWDCIFSSFLTVDFCPSGCHFSGHSCHSWGHFSDKIWPKYKTVKNVLLKAPSEENPCPCDTQK